MLRIWEQSRQRFNACDAGPQHVTYTEILKLILIAGASISHQSPDQDAESLFDQGSLQY